MKATKGFKDQVREEWGNLEDIGGMAMEELLDRVGLEFDDREKYALKIGILIGQTAHKKPTVFIKHFEEKILSRAGR